MAVCPLRQEGRGRLSYNSRAALNLLPGVRLGPYEILAPLGAGGMGEVYRARDAKLNRDVALKVLLPEVANDSDRLARFRRESQVLASLNHPSIGAIHTVEEAAGIVALVMELVEGEELSQRLEGARQAKTSPAQGSGFAVVSSCLDHSRVSRSENRLRRCSTAWRLKTATRLGARRSQLLRAIATLHRAPAARSTSSSRTSSVPAQLPDFSNS
jgi:serine/threonine protein kinase